MTKVTIAATTTCTMSQYAPKSSATAHNITVWARTNKRVHHLTNEFITAVVLYVSSCLVMMAAAATNGVIR